MQAKDVIAMSERNLRASIAYESDAVPCTWIQVSADPGHIYLVCQESREADLDFAKN